MLDRWTINLATGAVTTERRDDRAQEFPRINETLLGGRHRFGYTVGCRRASSTEWRIRPMSTRAVQARLRERIQLGSPRWILTC